MAAIDMAETDQNKPFYQKLYFQVVMGILLGGLIGYISPEVGASLKPLGTGFIKLVKMIIPPVIFLTIAHGIGSMRDGGTLRHVGLKAMGYFLVLSTLALVFGLISANLIRPGEGMNVVLDSTSQESVSGFVQSAGQMSAVDHILHIIPNTLLSPFAGGEVIQVLFVAVIFGLALMKIGQPAQGIVDGMASILTVVFKIVGMLMKFAPIGAFGAIAYTIGAHGISSIGNLLGLVATFYLTAVVFISVVMGSICWYHKIPMLKLLAYIKDEIILVLGTSSSEPALPSLMRKLEHAGASEASVGLVLPLGYSFNLDGINIYMTLSALFIAQALNIDLTLGEQLSILLIAVISSKGAAGVAGAGFVILATTLSTVDTIPVAGMALILGIDRFMSECRALTSFIGNAITTVAVAKSSGELDYDRFIKVMNGEDVDGGSSDNVTIDPLQKQHVSADNQSSAIKLEATH